jgi:hypothetical protein
VYWHLASMSKDPSVGQSHPNSSKRTRSTYSRHQEPSRPWPRSLGLSPSDPSYPPGGKSLRLPRAQLRSTAAAPRVERHCEERCLHYSKPSRPCPDPWGFRLQIRATLPGVKSLRLPCTQLRSTAAAPRVERRCEERCLHYSAVLPSK